MRGIMALSVEFGTIPCVQTGRSYIQAEIFTDTRGYDLNNCVHCPCNEPLLLLSVYKVHDVVWQ